MSHFIFKASKRYTTSSSSDNRFWSSLLNWADTLLKNRNSINTQLGAKDLAKAPTLSDIDHSAIEQTKSKKTEVQKDVKEEKKHENGEKIRGLQKKIKAPTLSDIDHSAIEQTKSKKTEVQKDVKEEKKHENGEKNRGLQKKIKEEGDDTQNEQDKPPKDTEKFKVVKNLALSMATKLASLTRELKSIKSDMYIMHHKCNLLEEENRRLRDGSSQGIVPDEDNLVILQLKTLLAEKSGLANENATLRRENQCLSQVVEYHRITSYENLIQEERGRR